jgi:hypothetical protein
MIHHGNLRTGLTQLVTIDQLADFCRRWKIEQLAVFGSVLRPDFGPDSDVDFLVRYLPDASWSLFDHVTMELELQEIVGRPVDLVTYNAVERSHNWIRRNEILGRAVVIISNQEPVIES